MIFLSLLNPLCHILQTQLSLTAKEKPSPVRSKHRDRTCVMWFEYVSSQTRIDMVLPL